LLLCCAFKQGGELTPPCRGSNLVISPHGRKVEKEGSIMERAKAQRAKAKADEKARSREDQIKTCYKMKYESERP
jgi:hypothetical protein